MQTKLYVIRTHPCRTAMLMLEHKGIPYRNSRRSLGRTPVVSATLVLASANPRGASAFGGVHIGSHLMREGLTAGY